MSHNNNNVNNAYANLGGSSSGDSNGSRSEQYEEFQRKQKELREEREAFHERLENKAMAAAVEAWYGCQLSVYMLRLLYSLLQREYY
jgi:hypothetical protein